MKLDIKSVAEGGTLPFSGSVDLSELDFSGQRIYPEPLEVMGEVSQSAGVLTLNAAAETLAHYRCDRCGVMFVRPKRLLIECVLVDTPAAGERDDFVLIQNDCCDLDDVISTAAILDVETKILCSESCVGLCGRCGKNLNEGPCSCEPELDSRFAALKDFFE